jgi:hypothetical protein
MRRLLEAISEQMESKQVFRGEDGALYHYPTYGEEEGVAAGERKLLGGPQADRYSKCNSRIAQGVVTKQLNSPEKLFENKAAEIAECRTRKMLTLDAVPYKYDLMDFLQLTIDMEQDNYMTRAFSGTLAFSFFGNPSQITDDQKLTLAKKAMRRFAFIGDTSDYATAVDLFYFTFNIDYVQKKADDLANAKRNVSAKKTEKIPAVDAAVLAANKLDEAVYNDAKALYAEKLELMHKLKQDASYQPPSSERDHADVKILFGDD